MMSYPPPAYPPQPPTEHDTLTPLPGSYPPEPSKYPPSSTMTLPLTTRTGVSSGTLPPPPPPPPHRVPVPPLAAPQPINTDPVQSSSADSEEYDFGSPIEGPDGEESFYIDSVEDGILDGTKEQGKSDVDLGADDDGEMFLGEEDWEDVGFDIGEKPGLMGKESTKPQNSLGHSKLPSSSSSSTSSSTLTKREETLKKKEDEIKVRESQVRAKERDLKLKADELRRKEEEIKTREEDVRVKEKVFEERETRRAKAREELLRRKEQESSNPPQSQSQSQRHHHHHSRTNPDDNVGGRTTTTAIESRDPVGGRISVAESPSRKNIESTTEDTTSLYEISRRRASEHRAALRSSEVGGSGGGGGGTSKHGFAPTVTWNSGSGGNGGGVSGGSGSGSTRPYSTASDFAQRRGQVGSEKKGSSSSAAAAAGSAEEQASSLMDSSVNWQRFSMWQNS